MRRFIVKFFKIIGYLGVAFSLGFFLLGILAFIVSIYEISKILLTSPEEMMSYLQATTNLLSSMAIVIISIGVVNTFFKSKIEVLESSGLKLPFTYLQGFETIEKLVIDILVTTMLIVVLANIVNYTDIMTQSMAFFMVLFGISLYLFVMSKYQERNGMN